MDFSEDTKKRIVLEFNESNNFDPNVQECTTEEIATTAQWIINCAMNYIAESYESGSPRLREMIRLHESLNKQIISQVEKY